MRPNFPCYHCQHALLKDDADDTRHKTYGFPHVHIVTVFLGASDCLSTLSGAGVHMHLGCVGAVRLAVRAWYNSLPSRRPAVLPSCRPAVLGSLPSPGLLHLSPHLSPAISAAQHGHHGHEQRRGDAEQRGVEPQQADLGLGLGLGLGL